MAFVRKGPVADRAAELRAILANSRVQLTSPDRPVRVPILDTHINRYTGGEFVRRPDLRAIEFRLEVGRYLPIGARSLRPARRVIAEGIVIECHALIEGKWTSCEDEVGRTAAD